MCMPQSNIRGLGKWNWEGDRIIHECIVPSSRHIPRYRKNYRIDVREFLIADKNEVIRQTLNEKVSKFVIRNGGDWNFFLSRNPGSFDYRAKFIPWYISKRVDYKRKIHADPWLFPDETLSVGEGDCEDRAFLIASLLISSGVSPYNVRVALGKVKSVKSSEKNENGFSYDHMWVMYKDETGHWQLIEPLLNADSNKRQKRGKSLKAFKPHKPQAQYVVEYKPYYVFNNNHLWAVEHNENRMKFGKYILGNWSKFKPAFAGEVHQNIIQRALGEIQGSESILQALNGYFKKAFINLIGPVIDDIDMRSDYDPRDHFDNGYINEPFAKVTLSLPNLLGWFGRPRFLPKSRVANPPSPL